MPHSTSYPTLVHLRHRSPRRPMSRDLRAFVWNMTMGRCWYCGSHANPYSDFCIDHIHPLARGGADAIENLVPACQHCNQTKAAKLLSEWRLNFNIAHILDEEPWIDPSGLFFFERDPFWSQRRDEEIRSYHRAGGVWL